MNPFFDELAIDDVAQELPVHIELLAGGSGAFQLPSVCAAQRPVGFDPIALGDLALDPEVEAMQDTAVTAHPLLEPIRAGALIGVIRIMVDVLRGVQLIGGGPVAAFQISSN